MAKDESTGLSTAEREAVKERAAEVRSAPRGTGPKAAAKGRADVAAAIAKLPDDDQQVVQRLHDTILAAAPELQPRTWYGMPAYAANGKVVCFVQARSKFSVRYTLLGFNDIATLDAGDMWPTSYAINELTDSVCGEVAQLIQRATGGADSDS